MAMRSKVGVVKDGFMPGKPKKSRQGSGKNTKYAATSRNNKRSISWSRSLMYDMTLYTYLAPSKVCGGVGVFLYVIFQRAPLSGKNVKKQ